MHKLFWTIAGVSLLTACSSGSDSSSTVDGNELEQIKSQLVGLWDASKDINGVRDEVYISIDENLVMSNYDYQNDAFDEGDNCYETDPAGINKDQLIINSPTDVYLVQEGVDEKIADITLSISDDASTVSMLFNGEDGTGVKNLSRFTSLTETDLQPLCE